MNILEIEKVKYKLVPVIEEEDKMTLKDGIFPLFVHGAETAKIQKERYIAKKVEALVNAMADQAKVGSFKGFELHDCTYNYLAVEIAEKLSVLGYVTSTDDQYIAVSLPIVCNIHIVNQRNLSVVQKQAVQCVQQFIKKVIDFFEKQAESGFTQPARTYFVGKNSEVLRPNLEFYGYDVTVQQFNRGIGGFYEITVKLPQNK